MTTIRQLGRQLRKDGIEVVTLESTSDYRRIWFIVLEAAGLAVQLDGATQAKNLPGRPKTDLLTQLRRCKLLLAVPPHRMLMWSGQRSCS